MKTFKRLERKQIYKGAIIDVYRDQVETPAKAVVEWDFIGYRGAAAVVPVTVDGKIVMVRQWRNALDRYTLEIPAGGLLNVQEEAIECAKRELEEETGYKCNRLEYLMSIRTEVAFCNEKIDVYVARDLEPSVQNLDPDEFITVEVCDLEELKEMIYTGKLQDSKTIAALLGYENKYLKG